MRDSQAERIRILETRVQRWRLVSLALMLVVVSFLAIACTFGLIFIISQPDRRQIEIMRMEQEARQAAEQAMLEAEQAKQQQMQQKNQW